MSSNVNNARIAKNTIMLYIRTALVMCISIYCSRVILDSLGVDDFGIYQVVGGIVGMFSLISASLSASISRYITFEIGRGNVDSLKDVFSTSLRIQFVISALVIILAEAGGLWFINYKMSIPADKVIDAQIVFQFSLISFCVNLISVPYNACIIAHERMKTFAYISIVDAVMRLGVCLSLYLISRYRLIAYASMIMAISIIVRAIYTWYCHRNFPESRGGGRFNRTLFKEMLSFSGWSFFTNSAAIINNQGLTMLINVYFGLAVNTARGLAFQVESALMQFVSSFTVSINPQITKSYAAGEHDAMYQLVCRGTKFCYFAMFMMGLPLIFEAEPVLRLWLGTVPEHTVIFVRLSIILGMIDCIGMSGFTACMATGKLKKYALVITPIGYIEFPVAWILFYLGAPAVSAYYLFVVVKSMVIVARMFLLREMVGLPVKMYLQRALMPVIFTSAAAIALPLIVSYVVNLSWIAELFIIGGIALISAITAIVFVGMTRGERKIVLEKVSKSIHKT